MEEQTINAEERLKQLNEERKALKVQVKDERFKRLELAAEMRVGRDEKIEQIQNRLKGISEAIYRYNKLGKVEKMNVNILIDIRAKCYDEDAAEETTDNEEDGKCQHCKGEGCEACDATKIEN